MCGIIGCAGDITTGTLIEGLENLEYRGYDSAGVALQNGSDLVVTKREGEVDDLSAAIDGPDSSKVGIGHTRWSTHGPPTDANAHPHVDCTGDVAVVHNGIIENHESLRRTLSGRGHEFTSDTDTEVVPHLVEEQLADGADAEAAFRSAIDALEGSYAVAMLVESTETIYATRQDSPLVVGLGDDDNYVASDVTAFLEHTDRVIFLEDGDVAAVTPEDLTVTDAAGGAVTRTVQTVDWSADDAEKSGYDHYMLKEIHEQPAALARTVRERIGAGNPSIPELPADAFVGVTSVQFVACGTSYHASLYGSTLLSEHGVPASAHLASEYAASTPPVDDSTLVVGVTQSGETADTLAALRRARTEGARTLALTNVVGSTAARECDETLFIRAGPEIGVAATKTFSSQVAALVLFAERLVRDVTGSPSDGAADRLEALAALPDQLESVLTDDAARRVVDEFVDSDSFFFVGRGVAHSVSLEGALKFKEITYEHAEGFAAGELKHGPLALVTPRTPVFATFTGRHDDKLAGNVSEIQARGAPVVAVAPENSEGARVADVLLPVPDTHPDLVAVLANVRLQLLAYHAAAVMDRPIDKPRNLAKSVTVE